MKHLGAKAVRATRNLTSFTRGLILGACVVIAANSLGHVVMIQIMPNTVDMVQEAMK